MLHIIELHDVNSPDEVIPLDVEDYSVCFPYLSGALVRLKSSDSLFPVHETPKEIEKMVKEAREE